MLNSNITININIIIRVSYIGINYWYQLLIKYYYANTSISNGKLIIY